MTVSWVVVRDAIHAWIVSGSGLAAGSVLWSKQAAARVAGPYITIGSLGLQTIGQDWNDIEDAAVPVPGADITHRARGCRTWNLSIQAFGASSLDANAPEALLEAVIASRRRPSVHAALVAGGCGIGVVSAVQSIGESVNSVLFEPRAVVNVQIHLTSELAADVELGTYIESVEIDGIVDP